MRFGKGGTEFSVHFVRENRQAVFVRDIEQRASNGGRIDGTRRIVGVNRHEHARARRYRVIGR